MKSSWSQWLLWPCFWFPGWAPELKFPGEGPLQRLPGELLAWCPMGSPAGHLSGRGLDWENLVSSMDSCWMLLNVVDISWGTPNNPNITKWDWFFGNCSRKLRNFEAWISMDSIEKLAASNPPHFASNYWANTRMIRPEFYHGPGNHQHNGFAQESNGGRNRYTAPGNALCDVDKRWQTEDDTRSFRIFRDSTWLQNGCSMGDPKNNWFQYLHGSMWLKQS